MAGSWRVQPPPRSRVRRRCATWTGLRRACPEPWRAAFPALGADELDGADWWFRTRFDADARRNRRGARAGARRHRDGRRGLPERRARARQPARCSNAHGSTSAAASARVPTSSRSAAGRWARCWQVRRARAPVGARGSCQTATCASSARCCWAALPALRPGRRPSAVAAGPARAPAGRCVDQLRLRPRIDDGRGVLAVGGALRWLDGTAPPESVSVELADAAGVNRGRAREWRRRKRRAGRRRRGDVPDVRRVVAAHARRAALYDARLIVGAGASLSSGASASGSCASREISSATASSLRVNGVPVFAAAPCGRRSS